MQFNSVAFQFKFFATAPLSSKSFDGIWIRGLVGKIFEQAFCSQSELICKNCPKQTYCEYPQIFKPSVIENTRLPAYNLHGWKIENAGYVLTFSLVFLGQSSSKIESLLLAFARENKHLQNPDGIELVLSEISSIPRGQKIYLNRKFQSQLKLNELSTNENLPKIVKIKLLTPFVIKTIEEKEDRL